VSWPDFVWVFAATALSCSASLDFLPPIYLGTLIQYRARKQSGALTRNSLLTRAVL